MEFQERYQRVFSRLHSNSEICWEEQGRVAGRKKPWTAGLIAAAVAVVMVAGVAAAAIALTRARFPAVFPNLTQYSAEIYGVEPFQVSIALPEGCTLSTDYLDPGNAQLGWSPVELQIDGKAVGVMDYNIFELYPDGPGIHEEGFYRMVYNQLMLNVQGNWDNDYTVVSQSENSENAVTQVAFTEDYGNGRSDNPVVYQPGILAYNTDLLVYVNILLEPGAFTEAQINDMAASITLSR